MKTNGACDGFTLVEMLVVISVIALLFAILMPALSKALDTNRSMLCTNNLRSIGQADALYTMDNNSWFARADYYVDNLAFYTDTSTKFYYTPSIKADGLKAFPFICSMMLADRAYWGIYGGPWCTQNTHVRPDAPNPSQTCISTYSLNSSLHGRGTQPATQTQLKWRKTEELVHSPSLVLNYMDGDPTPASVGIDYSTFTAFARHGDFKQATIGYADGHAILFKTPGSTPSLGSTTFYRGAGNTTIDLTVAPYYWW
jgi:prepilin-type N-terminal cleavage/methylation domain-containing protein/prepilin-type processing-associated H-X9-DG protein